MYKRTPTRVPLDGTEATLVDRSWPVNKDHKISNPAAPIGWPRSRGHGARRPIGRPPRGCEDVLNDAPQCTWLTKADFPRGSLGSRGRGPTPPDRRSRPTVASVDAHPRRRVARARSAHTSARLPNLPHSKNGRTQNNTARADESLVDGGTLSRRVSGAPAVRAGAARSLHHLRDARHRRVTSASCVASAASNRRPVNEIENDGRVHCGHYGGESGRPPG